MNTKLMLIGMCFAMGIFARLCFAAVPSAEEIKAVMPKIEEITRDDFAAVNAKKKSHVQTAGRLLGYISEDDDSVTEFILRQLAFRQYVLGKSFGDAGNLYSEVRAECGVEYALEIAKPARTTLFGFVSPKIPTAKRLFEWIQKDEKLMSRILAIKAKIRKNKEDKSLFEDLAIEYVAFGDWRSAMALFGRSSGRVAEVARWELCEGKGDDFDEVSVADFWWTYAGKYDKRKQICDLIKVHASDWYKKAIATGRLSGLDAKVAAKRIEEASVSNGESEIAKDEDARLYLLVDLMKPLRGVSYLKDIPKGGWSDEFKTTKIVLRKVLPGAFEYMPGRCFKLTRPYYIGVFEVTQKQYELVMGLNPSENKGDTRPVEQVRYVDVRGSSKGMGWPANDDVDNESFLGKLRKRTGMRFDLPTEAQWEYACRAGTTGDRNVPGVRIVELGKCNENGGQRDRHAKVGSFRPNAWGLYDMHGNVREWCLDRSDGSGKFGWASNAKESDDDPKGPANGESRILRGGAWHDDARDCLSTCRARTKASVCWNGMGFRLCCPVK